MEIAELFGESNENHKEVEGYENSHLSGLLAVFGQHFGIVDKLGFTIIIATAVAHQLPGEMVWLRFYGASRSGKTEILRAIAKHSDSAEMEVITPAALRGGLEEGKRLLTRLDGKLVITKDLAAILTNKREARTELAGVLRHVKDGTLTADFGTKEGHIEQKAKFDWIIGTTPVFAQYKKMEDLLGTRYIDLNWKAANRGDMALQALGNNPNLTEIRKIIAEAVCKLIDAVKEKQQLRGVKLDSESAKWIADWADLTALLRSPVSRDAQHRIKFQPQPEVGTDLAQGFSRIALGLNLLGIDNYKPYIARLAQDSIPYSRRQAVRQLLSGGVDEVSIKRDYYYDLEDLGELNIVRKSGGKWQFVPELMARIAGLAYWWD